MQLTGKTKKVIKGIGLAVMGLGLLGGIVAVASQFVGKNEVSADLSYEVGGLTEYGKYEEDEGSLYTKEKFACEGLKATLAFDATINYKIFYYDILDNFISATTMLNSGYSGEAPLNGAYARIEITPISDEDGKISWTEKIKYSNQLTVKVAKGASANVSQKFVNYRGNNFQVVNNMEDSIFEYGTEFLVDTFEENKNNEMATTTKTLLAVKGGSTITFDDTELSEAIITCYIFNDLPVSSDMKYTAIEWMESLTLEKTAKYVLIRVYTTDTETLKTVTGNLPKMFSVK